MTRHDALRWDKVQQRIEANAEKLWSLSEMEATGGEPDVIGQDRKTGKYIFCDCAEQSPKGRRHVCYDREGQQKREKEGLRPAGNVIDMAAALGIDVLTEEEYFRLQQLGDFDTRTQSWVQTPAEIGKLGGALFVEKRFGRVFVGANTAQCFFGNRGFRGLLKV